MQKENNQQTQEVSVGFISDNEKIEIVFADGARRIPDYIVGYFGRENLEKLAPSLIKITFGEFTEGITRKVNKDSLNEWQQSFVASHFGNVFW
jgi:hypothetical protein